MCREILPDEHSHVVALENRNLLCTCRACYLLFTREGAAQGKYKTVPERYLYDPGFTLSEADWDALQVPVKMAFFFYNSTMERLVAFYPSPAGATESLLPAEGWPELLRMRMEADVEALLVSRSTNGFECFLVPIDACYELVGRVRRSWKGFDGGQEAWADIESFFTSLRERSKQVTWAS
jgi:hypothetical protein